MIVLERAVWFAPELQLGVVWEFMDAIENQILARPATERRPSFWSEFQDYWARVPDKGLFLTLLAGWCGLFQFVGISSFNFGTTEPSLFEWMHNAWNAPAM